MRRSWMTGWSAAAAVALCALATAGCASIPSSGIDPTGERVFTAPPAPADCNPAPQRYFDEPMGQLPWDDVAVQLQPRETIAPVGSEVVLVAGVCGPDGYLRTNRRLEWSIDPGSVGHFVAVEKGGLVDLLLGDFNWPRKINNTFAVGSTSRSNVRLNRGTGKPEDSVLVLRGQGWITLTSPVEGTSNVTVVAPEVYNWDARICSATVHWVDAQWQFPPPAINPAGTRHVFTTVVTRQSNQSPCQGWRVRYEIVDGPPAGFSPHGAASIEVPTDSAGQASVEIFQKQPCHGTNKVCIQVIRPADVPGVCGRSLVVGSGTTMKTWTAADLAVHKTGPAAANLGATLTYRIEISNPGDLPLEDVVATDVVPDGLTYLGSNPPAEAVGGQLQWRLGNLGARGRRSIEVNFRAERPGSVTNRCEVAAAGGLKHSGRATTTIASSSLPTSPRPASLEVRITGPTQETVEVGSQVTFQIIVTNRGRTPATGLRIKDSLDEGLEHKEANRQNAIERMLGELAAGASRQVGVTLRVTKPGRLCHTVEVSGPNVVAASARACVTAVAAAPELGQPSIGPPLGGMEQPLPSAAAAPLSIKKTGPKQLLVGETARFTIDVTNTGTTALRDIKVVDRYDPALAPTLATDGYRIEQGGLAWTIDNLPAGKATRLEVHCTCQTAAQTYNRASATMPDGAEVEDEAYLEIRAADDSPMLPEIFPRTPLSSDDLKLSVAGLYNPVAAGKELTYEIRVTNQGTVSYRQLSVTATVPEGMVPDPLGTVGPGATKFTIDRQTVRFDPLPEAAAGQSLTYRVRVLAQRAGRYRFRAELSSPALSQPLVQEASTEVF